VGIRVGDLNFVLQNRLYLINGLVEFEAAGSVFPHAADDRAAQTAKIHTARLGRFALEDVDIEGVRQRRLSINNTLDFTGTASKPNPNTLIRQLLLDVLPFQLRRRKKGRTSAASTPLHFFLFSFQFSFFLWIKLGRFLSFLLALIFLTFIRHICFSLS